MKTIAFLIGCACALTACSGEREIDARNASAEDVARKVADAGGSEQFVRPGKWQSTVTIEEMSMPGMPKELTQRMGDMARHTRTAESCLTPEEAKRPKEGMFAGEGKNCRYDRFTMGNGKIDAVMQCAGDGATQTMTLAGTYSGDTYQMRMATKSSGGVATEAGMEMKMRIDAKRVGECDGKTA